MQKAGKMIDDYIDESVWLPEGEQMVTPERAKKDDIFFEVDCKECLGKGKNNNQFCKPCKGRGRVKDNRPPGEIITDIRYAQVCVRNILNFLWENDVITNDQHEAGCVFKAWRDQHRVAMGQQRPVSNETAETLSVKLRAYGYVLILKKLNPYDYRTIDTAVETYESEHTRYFALRDSKAFKGAFYRLHQLLPPIKERIVYLERLTDEERESLADDALKKFLASISPIV